MNNEKANRALEVCRQWVNTWHETGSRRAWKTALVCLEIAREEQAKINLAFEFNLAAFRLAEETLKKSAALIVHERVEYHDILVNTVLYGCQHFVSGELLFITPFG